MTEAREQSHRAVQGPEARNVLEEIVERRHKLTGKFMVLANFVTQHYRRVAFMSARELAREAGVSLATVVRFASVMGFTGYQPFIRAVQQRVNMELTGVERLVRARDTAAAEPLHVQVVTREREALQQLLLTLTERDVNLIAQRLATAPAVAIVGVRYLAPLAAYLGYTMRKIRPWVTVFEKIDSATYDDLALLPRGAVVVIIGFARYPNELVQLVEFAAATGLETIAVTDQMLSPVAVAASRTILVPVPPMELMAHLAAPAALINVLVTATALLCGERALSRLETIEKVAHQQRTYYGVATRDIARLIPPGRRQAGGRKKGKRQRGKRIRGEEV